MTDKRIDAQGPALVAAFATVADDICLHILINDLVDTQGKLASQWRKHRVMLKSIIELAQMMDPSQEAHEACQRARQILRAMLPEQLI